MISKQVVRWGDGSYDRNEQRCMLCSKIYCYGQHGLACNGCENPVTQLEDVYGQVSSAVAARSKA